jgi:cytochrome c oxidase cbb3-type subunit 3
MKYSALGFIALVAFTSCDSPGRRATESAPVRPSDVADFRLLYSQNCSGCHGANGQGALTVGIGRPVYLAIADDASIRRVIEEGRPGTAMQGFAQKAGGLLTDTQVDILVRGIRSWAKLSAFGNENPPPYTASQPGDAARGQDVFKTFCSSCHGADGRGARAIADPSYLALVTDQHLRTVIITGMPQLGMPDWRSHAKPLSDADVTDIVAWLAPQRESLSAQVRH